jgi:integrase
LGWERRLLEVLFFTGMRRGEGFGLRWSNVFFDRGVIAVRRSLTIHGESSPKTGRSIRDIEMLPRAREALLEQRRWMTGRFELGREFVFSERSRQPAGSSQLQLPGLAQNRHAGGGAVPEP